MASSNKPAVRARATSAFEIHERIRLADTDATGIIYFGAYGRFVESAETEFYRSLGFTLPELSSSGIVLPRVHVAYDFFKPAVLDDEVTLRVSVGGVGVHSIRLLIDIVRTADDATLAEATVISACMDRDRKSMPLPERLADTLRARIAKPAAH